MNGPWLGAAAAGMIPPLMKSPIDIRTGNRADTSRLGRVVLVLVVGTNTRTGRV